ncbi:MAG: glutaredoxin family protein [Betaproteobacteria bacterium]|nr:MAG: glutaredoxin family protein [Betaproteobacteria bacterium]
MPELVRLIIYGRKDCHLCFDMIAVLHELQTRLCFRIELVDVDSSAELAAQYGERVPVLVVEEEEICHFHLDPIALDAYFAKIR